MLVTTVGRDILLGRMLSEPLEPEDYSHLIVACLLHDIGFVRGVLSGDTVTPLSGQGSHQIAALGRANALIVVPEDVTRLPDGETVEVLVLP